MLLCAEDDKDEPRPPEPPPATPDIQEAGEKPRAKPRPEPEPASPDIIIKGK